MVEQAHSNCSQEAYLNVLHSCTTGAKYSQWYQPDTIVYHTINGKGYLFTANEGDAKDNYEMEVSDLADDQFDLEHFSDPTNTKKDHQMGKLKINPFCGLKNGYDTSKGVKEQ
eukprot:scaffold66804_cov31-Tisochrysis_lutea.AAC.2